MAGEEMNVRGPCSSCGATLASDQRYCVECGQRVGPPLAMPYALPTSAPATAAAGAPTGRVWRLPIAPEMASLLAALALGLGVVVGTAISPNLAGIVAAPSPSVVAQAPPPAPTPSTPSTGGGGGAAPAPATSAGSSTIASATPTGSSGGGGGGGTGGGGGGKKNKKKPASGISFSGTVVRSNPVAQSYTLATSGGLIAIHADTLPQVGSQVESAVRKLNNGTYAESSGRNPVGNADVASVRGTVTYCADLEHPSAPCDGSAAADHYVYTVSSLGASVLVSWPHSASNPPPKLGSQVQVAISIGTDFAPIAPASPSDWRQVPDCTPPYSEQNGQPTPPVVTKELTQSALTVTGTATSAMLASVVQARCTTGTPRLVLSADDIREAGRDLAPFDASTGFDLNKLNPGQAVQAAVDIAGDGTLTLKGITSDQGAAGADDPSQGQGTLTGS
jgi:hypothetical protein